CRIEHRSACSAVVGHGRHVGMHHRTRTLQFGSYAFAGSLVEILLTITHGGCVCIPSEEQRRSDLALAISRMRINWAFLTSTVLDLLRPEAVPSLTTLCVGGEPIRISQIAQWETRVHLRQTYGSSEMSGVVSSLRLNNTSSTKDVGRASTGICWIVDPNDHSKLAPIGAVGEVLIEGAILGREYIDEPDKTASTFIEAPAWRGSFGANINQPRLYKTGDLARYKQDGSIELLGRKDNQVKLRGQRIELEEIEHQAKLASTYVKQIAVELIRPQEDEDGMLACFIVVNDSTDPPAHEDEEQAALRTHTQNAIQAVQARLEEWLPQYMVPSVFIPVPGLPATSSRKIDRKRLREIGASFSAQQLAEMRAISQGPKRLPSTQTEQTLQQLWGQALQIEPQSIGLDDSFFRLGGDSIMAMELVGEARRIGMHLSVADIFRNPTLADLASLDYSHSGNTAEDILPFSLLGEEVDVATVRKEAAVSCGVDAGLVEDLYQCSPLQEGLVSLTSKRAGDYIMQSVLELRDEIDEETFRAAWEYVFRSMAVLRTRIVQNSKLGLLQAVIAEGIRWREAEELEEYLEKDKSVSMGLGEPLTRYAIVTERKEEKRWIVWTIHHALYDGWSLPRIIDAVTKAYTEGMIEPQPSFHAFIKYLNQQDQEITALYWQDALYGCQATLFPPLPSAVQQPVADAMIDYQCPPLLKAPSDTTTSTLVRAAWAIVASRYTNSDDVVFGTTVTGRNAPVDDIEAMIGPTIATVPVRVRVAGDQTVSAFLQGLQQQATDMIPYEQTGLQRIAKMSADARHACGFQTLLVIQPINDAPGSDRVLGEWHDHSEPQDVSTYGLMLQCTLAADGIRITASFDKRVVEEWLVKKILSQFSFIMQQLAKAQPGDKVANMDPLTPEERTELWAWNHETPAAIERCIHDLFAEHVQEQPDAPAICSWDGELTYDELDALSTRLASHLVGLGVKPEDIVPLCFEKSMWTVVAMLAVLKAGGAFLLLDLSLPHERLKSMCSRVSGTLALASQAAVPVAESLIQWCSSLNTLLGPPQYNPQIRPMLSSPLEAQENQKDAELSIGQRAPLW
ncbi:acetyl-CoA synthetase-like protein, partial [Lindgomyces ingoldianus]